MTYPDKEKEAFNSQLKDTIANVPAVDKLVLLGDFNARVGHDYNTWSPVLGKGNPNSNGELLLFVHSLSWQLWTLTSNIRITITIPGNISVQEFKDVMIIAIYKNKWPQGLQ